MDPLTLEVVRHALDGVCDEMGAALRRTAHSPNITEREDCSCALATPDALMCAQAEHIPVHLGAMPASLEAALAAYGDLRDGDAVLLNDPYAGGTHLNDLTLVSPVYLDGTLLGYVANRAHHADVGGEAPGSMPADATRLDQEGIVIPPTLAWRNGEPIDEMLERVVAASRAPAERRGDLRAQAGANAVGAERLRSLARRMGLEQLRAGMDALLDYSERMIRAGIQSLPDGEWSFEDRMDSTGAGRPPAAIRAAVRVREDQLTIDFGGTDPQVDGNVNAVLAVTVSCVTFVVRALCGPDVPPTAGAMRPVTVIAPEGTLVNAQPPRAVAAGNVETSQRITDVLFGAFAQAVPERVPAASQGTMNNLLIGGEGFAYYETIAGGQGARAGAGGMSGVHTGMTNTKNTPAEAIEYAYPLRILRAELRDGTGGTGRFPGGMGVRRDIEILAERATVTLQTERRASAPWGLAGGGDGARGRNALLRDGVEEELLDKCTIEARRGDVVIVETPGGGGWGEP